MDPPITPLRLFLSYGHDSNEELVRQIKTDLEKRGHDVWFDKNDIKFGDDWRRTITDSILNSHRVLSFLSKHSTRDPGVCRDEIAIAIGVKGGNIQTILVESEQEVKPPVNIGHIQWLDMHDWRERRDADEAAWMNWYQAKLSEIVRVVESDESRRFAGEIETLNGYLKPIRSEARISQLLNKGFYGRHWLFEAVEKWRQDRTSDSRLFWIMGAPGVGKSAFAAQLTHTRGDVVIGAQFCEWDKPDLHNASRVVRSIAFQLATRLPDYRKLLLTLPEIAELDQKDASELFDYLLANPLRSIIDGGREKYLILIDALDEAGKAGSNPLVEMLARNAQRLPVWLGLVVTSRPEFDVKTPLQALNPFTLDTHSESNRTDIRDYLRSELTSPLQNRPDADRLVEQILEKSEGVFLYVEHFCDDVQRGNLSLDRPEQFPLGLGGIYFQWFERQFPDLEKFHNEVRPALRAILAAREPLPLDILQQLFNWQDEELHDFTLPITSLFPVTKQSGREIFKVDKKAMADLMHWLNIRLTNGEKINLDDNTRPRLNSVFSHTTEPSREIIKPFHKSLADWLVVKDKAGPYFVSVSGGHQILGAFCSSRWQAGDTFALANLVYHLRSADLFDELAQIVLGFPFHHIKAEVNGGSLDDLLLSEAGANGRLGLAAAGFALCQYVDQISLIEALSASAQWMRDGVAEKLCAVFAMQVIETFRLERPESPAAIAAMHRNSWRTNWLDWPESAHAIAALHDYLTQGNLSLLVSEREVLKPKLANAKLAPRHAQKPYDGHTVHTSHLYEEYVENSLDAIDAALSLEPGRLVMRMLAISEFKTAYDCDGDPIWALTSARGAAIKEVNMRLVGLIRPLIELDSAGVRNLHIP